MKKRRNKSIQLKPKSQKLHRFRLFLSLLAGFALFAVLNDLDSLGIHLKPHDYYESKTIEQVSKTEYQLGKSLTRLEKLNQKQKERINAFKEKIKMEEKYLFSSES